MTDSFLPLLKGAIAALKADTVMAGLVGARVYSDTPQNATFPYVVVTVSSQPFDTKTSTGMAHTLQISGFSRKDSQLEAGQIAQAAYNLFHRQESALTLDSGTMVSLLYSGIGFVTKEPDGVTWQSVRRFDATIM